MNNISTKTLNKIAQLNKNKNEQYKTHNINKTNKNKINKIENKTMINQVLVLNKYNLTHSLNEHKTFDIFYNIEKHIITFLVFL